jgi:hypothetical protein
MKNAMLIWATAGVVAFATEPENRWLTAHVAVTGLILLLGLFEAEWDLYLKEKARGADFNH